MPSKTARFAELQDPQLATRLQRAVELFETSLIVGQIAESKGGDNQIERFRAQRQMERIGFERDCEGRFEFTHAAARLAQTLFTEFPRSEAQHAPRKVRGENWPRARGRSLSSAIVKSPVPQQMSRMAASGRASTARNLRAVLRHHSRSTLAESR